MGEPDLEVTFDADVTLSAGERAPVCTRAFRDEVLDWILVADGRKVGGRMELCFLRSKEAGARVSPAINIFCQSKYK